MRVNAAFDLPFQLLCGRSIETARREGMRAVRPLNWIVTNIDAPSYKFIFKRYFAPH